MKKSILSCLGSGYSEAIRDVLWGHVYLTPGLAALIRSGPFMRLHRIMQLGPAFYVYPGATHTRASHSIGVYHLAKRLLFCLAEQGADAWLSQEGVFSFLCAALLHDLGHFPYTHSLKELPLESHETLTARIICSEPVKSLVKAAGGDPEFTAAIIDTESTLPGGQGELSFYRRLLSGTLDPDKLDYLNRDARYCGVPYGAQDVDFILSCLHPHNERGADIGGRGIPSVESILFSKYLMYRAVYWHRQVRSATAMIKKAVLGVLEAGFISPDELYNLDDHLFFSLMESRKNVSSHALELLSLIQSVHDGRLYVPVAEFSFDIFPAKLWEINKRSELEESLAFDLSPVLKKIRKEMLIIDVPEPISFESGLYVADEGCFFPESSSTFKSEVVSALVKSLRIIRVFVDARSFPRGGKTGSVDSRILQITQKWLQLLT